MALENLPKLSGDFFANLLSRRSLVNAVRSISRVLKTTMCPDLLMQFGVQPNFIQTQRKGELNASDRSVISNLEMPPAFKKLSFLALIQWSTNLYPPATTKTSLYRIAQIPFIITRYSESAMQSVYGSLLLPYISGHHVALQFRLFEHSHISHSPSHPSSLGVFHLPLTSTLQGCRSGDFAHVASHQRRFISTLISRCAFCILHENSERLYSHTPGDPRLVDFLNSEDLPFHTISIDLLSEIQVRHHSKSRGKPSHTVSVLIALDLGTGAICLTVASDSKTPAVVKALKSLGLRFRFPKRIISDAGSSLANLGSHPELIAELTHHDVEFVPVGAGEQFSNPVERQVGQCKKILSSLKEDPMKSIYQQPNTLEELMGKLLSVESIMNARPILISHKDSGVQVMCPKMILSPYLTSTQLQSWVLDILEPLTALNTLASLVQKNHQAVLSALQVHLLDYLQTQGIKYQIRQGDNSKPDMRGLHPEVGDIVLYKTSDARKFGIISAILEKNMIQIRTTFYGSVQLQTKHKRLLVLVHRQSEWNPSSGLPIAL